MKKIAILMASVVLGASAYAQTSSEPNRLFVNDNGGIKTGYVLERITDLSFARVEGDVKAEVQIHEVTDKDLTVSITRTEGCQAFKLDVLPRSIAGMLTNDAAMINYINTQRKPGTFYEDFVRGNLSGIELLPGGEYTVVTVGIDQYGCEVGVCRENFNAPSVPVVGNPTVKATLKEATMYSYTVEFEPNSDVSTYYTVAGEKGTMQGQYEQFGPMFGFTSFNDMIMSWGIAKSGVTTTTWDNEAPNTDYEIFIVALDKNGNPAPYQVFEVSTLSKGGHGEAKVDITLGAYKLEDWNGEMKPSQYMTFTPNDQASCYRFSVYMEDIYDENEAVIKEDLCSDPPMPTAYWFFYEPMTTDYQIDPGKKCVAVGAAKNADGEWGEVTVLRFTTPESVAGVQSAGSNKIMSRRAERKQPMTFTPGKAPALHSPRAIEIR